jgi:RNA polymerase sigma-70 factor (ECF subfamily)
MTNSSEIQLFQQIKNGNVAAFNILFNNYYAQLCFFCSRYLVDMDLSRSLVQQVFVDLWIKREKLSIEYSIKSYLFQAVKNRAVDQLRQSKKNIQINDAASELAQIPFQDIIEEAELDDRINKSINHLPEKCREIFLMSRFESLKYIEIAEKLNISVKTVEMQIGVALKKLREELSDK